MTTVDRQIARASLARHGEPADIAALLRRVAAQLDDGDRAEEMVSLLAAEGWSSGTMGDGGARSSDSSSPTERAAGMAGEPDTPVSKSLGRWAGADVRYAEQLQLVERACQRFERLHADVMAHGDDRDDVPAGTGECQACGRFCRPTKARPGLRLRTGLCPACYGAYRDAGRPDPRSDWVRARRARLTDDAGKLHPEDDSDIDMSRER